MGSIDTGKLSKASLFSLTSVFCTKTISWMYNHSYMDFRNNPFFLSANVKKNHMQMHVTGVYQTGLYFEGIEGLFCPLYSRCSKIINVMCYGHLRITI